MDPSWVLSLPEGVTAAPAGPGELVLLAPHCRLTLRRLPAGCREALGRLVFPGAGAGELSAAVRAADGPGALALWYYHVQALAQRSLLWTSVHAGGQPLATLVPTARGFVFDSDFAASAGPHVLSRFAYMRRRGAALLLESPRALCRVVLHDRQAAALVAALVRPSTAAELAGCVPADAVAPLLGLLGGAGMLTAVGAQGTTAEDADPVLGSWEFHDLLFHARSRPGRHDAPLGATFSGAGVVEQPPAVRPPLATATIDLDRPDLDALMRRDPPFAQVQEMRRSLREYADEPLTAAELGEFLYRVARVRGCRDLDVAGPNGPVRMQLTSRPYPAPGGLYELEVYPVVHACRGLAAGLYRYDPVGHRLERLSGRTAEVESLLAEAARSTGMDVDRLQVLLTMAARFPRVTWKYSMLAYALTLKHVGVLVQTMYLAATAMGLAPCAVGAGDSDLFARAAGLDYYAEPAVGEFLLGSRRGD